MFELVGMEVWLTAASGSIHLEIIWLSCGGSSAHYLKYRQIFSRDRKNTPSESCALASLLFSSVQFSRSVVSYSLGPHELHHARPPCPSPTPGVYSNSCPSSQWCHPAISSSVIPFSSCPPVPPSIRVFSNESTLFMRWPKYWSFSFIISPSNEHPDWSPLGWTGWISLQSKGLSRAFSNTIVQKHQFFGTQLSWESNSHIHTWPLEKP